MQLKVMPIAFAIAVLLVTSSFALTGEGSDWSKPFVMDEFTEVLYHFDEGRGNKASSACGDPELVLRTRGKALWGEREGFEATAKFDRNPSRLFIGDANNDKTMLRNCTEAWTIEAWTRYTGPGGKDSGGFPNSGFTSGVICGTDEEGFWLPHGYRSGWSFRWMTGYWPHKADYRLGMDKGVLPGARFMGNARLRDPRHGVMETGCWNNAVDGWHGDKNSFRVYDSDWHHVAWQFRYRDQTHFFYIDGRLARTVRVPISKDSKSMGVINDAPRCDIPFHVGGWLATDPGDTPHVHPRYGNFEGEIDELRISRVLRYPVAEKVRIIRDYLPVAGQNIPYSHQFGTDAAKGDVSWKLEGDLPTGMKLDAATGTLSGAPTEVASDFPIKVTATDASGASDTYTLKLSVEPGQFVTESLPTGTEWENYYAPIEVKHLAGPLTWSITAGELPPALSFDSDKGLIQGWGVDVSETPLTISVRDANGVELSQEFTLRILPDKLRVFRRDEHAVALYDWQGPSGRYFEERVTLDPALALTYANMGGDLRYSYPGRDGPYPQETGHAEHAYAQVGPGRGLKLEKAAAAFKSSPRLDLKTCKEGWTVEAWIRSGGEFICFGQKDHRTGKPKPFEHGWVCGNYAANKRGTWALYITNRESPNGKMVPGATFQSKDHTWENLDPWHRPEGIVGDESDLGIGDTEWHHIAWQYDYATDTHELFLDGKLIWKLTNPDGRKLVNNLQHNWQFSVFCPLWKYTKYGGGFSYLGPNNFFGQIGDIRISDIRRYE